MSYQLNNNVAIISIDDGKANAVNHNFIDQLYANLDRAEKEASAVILTGREGMFSAGFDLKALQVSPEAATELVGRGMEMLTRLYEFPLPLISACAGHAIGMGAFLLMASDNRIGAEAEYQVTLPETAISMGFTQVLLTLIHDRIASSHKTTAMIQSTPHTAQQAVPAGFLDEVVAADQLMDRAQALAEKLTELPKEFYALNKRDLRAASLKAMHDSLK